MPFHGERKGKDSEIAFKKYIFFIQLSRILKTSRVYILTNNLNVNFILHSDSVLYAITSVFYLLSNVIFRSVSGGLMIQLLKYVGK